MIVDDQQALIESLGPYAKKALLEGAALCVEQCGYEVTIEHFFFKALDYPASDLIFILRQFGIDKDELQNNIARCFERQKVGAQDRPVFSPLLLELLQDAWTVSGLLFKKQNIQTGVILYAALKNNARYLRYEYVVSLSAINSLTLKQDFNDITLMSGEASSASNAATAQQTQQDSSVDQVTGETPLDKYGVDFTEKARQGKIDPVLCREKELDQIIDILLRRRKNNPITVGEPGVGKSAVVEGLALRIIEKKVPKALQEVALWGLDMGSLQAGASMKGEFEKRLKGVIDQVKNSTTPIVLFIDEAHTLIGAGGQAGGGDAANLLKPALARGELRTIAATTWSEYKKYFEKDPALARRFQLVKLAEPSIEQSQIILRGLLPLYEKTHHVYVLDSALEAAARLSARYISGRQLPDKAIDVLDTACARVSSSLTAPPRILSHSEQQLKQLHAKMKMIKRDLQFDNLMIEDDDMTALESEIDTTEARIVALQSAWKIEQAAINAYLKQRQAIIAAEEKADNEHDNDSEIKAEEKSDTKLEDNTKQEQPAVSTADIKELNQLRQVVDTLHAKDGGLIRYQVGEQEIAAVIADWTGIPVSSMTADDVARITSFPKSIGQLIKGQDEGINKIYKRLLTAKADLRREGLPLGAFLLVGPSGVGKSETAIQIANLLFGSSQLMTTINMSEYQEKHSMSRLIGSPPGYVGYGEGGVLTEAIRQQPYSVVLLDEVEKADPDVLNLFYQAFDKGEMNDGEGRAIDCKNIVFILTSNLGTDEIMTYADAGNNDITVLEERLFPILSNWFKPALLARMETIPYFPLNKAVLMEIIKSKLSTLSTRLNEKYKMTLKCTNATYEHIQSRCNRSHNGARIIDSVLEGEMLPPLSLRILESLANQETLSTVIVDIDEGHFTYQYQHLNESNESPASIEDT